MYAWAGRAALASLLRAKPGLLEERTDLTPDIVKSMVRNGVYTMPASRKTGISDDDLIALAAYLSGSTAIRRALEQGSARRTTGRAPEDVSLEEALSEDADRAGLHGSVPVDRVDLLGVWMMV